MSLCFLRKKCTKNSHSAKIAQEENLRKTKNLEVQQKSENLCWVVFVPIDFFLRFVRNEQKSRKIFPFFRCFRSYKNPEQQKMNIRTGVLERFL